VSRFYTNIQLLGDKVLYRGYETDEQVTIKDEFSPTLFVKSNIETKYKTLNGIYVQPIKFSGVREARDFIKKYEGVDNFEIYGNDRFLYQYISKHFPDEIQYDISKIKLVTIDIETTSENGFPKVEDASEEILCITVKDFTSKKILVWGQKEYQNNRKDVVYETCWDEETLLKKFHHWWVMNTPDILTGWNVKLFDVPYICKRIIRVLGEKFMNSLSPWNKVNEEEYTISGRKTFVFNILGMSTLDYLDLYKKFTYTNQESYRLDHIASVELGEAKLDHSEFETFKEFYTRDWQKFVDYNIHDVELVDRLEDKMKLIELAVTMAYDAKVNYEDVYSQVRTWDAIIYNYLLKKDIVIPPNQRSQKDSQYAGAYVKEPKPGLYDWVASFDLNSLYPHLIMQYNLSPETLLEKKHPTVGVEKILKQSVDLSSYSDYCVCPNGSIYRKDIHGFLPELMEKIYSERTVYKKKMLAAKREYEETKNSNLLKDISKYNNIQMARKIQLNSAYGAIGNQYFRYFRLEIAEAITLSGQVSIRWIENKMNKYLNKILGTEEIDYVIASDTDSIYLNLGPLVSRVFGDTQQPTEKIVDALDKFCEEKIQPFIDNSYQQLADYLNAYDQKMQMKRETIADKGIWTAKKRYILNAWDIEGVRYHEPKMKIMGIESVKSSTPAFYRDKLSKSFRVIMSGNNDDLIEFIQKTRKETKQQPLPEISFPRSVNGMSKYRGSSELYVKGTPINVRGALLYNHYLKKMKLNNKYAEILDGEKIKFLYLKAPNPFGENVIAYIQELPREFGLDKYIDYELQFEKAFLEPLKTVVDCIGWQTEKRGSLESFFL
jgi:DNA polymerase elongation subunit (family B)